MGEGCHESGRVLMYQWKLKDLQERSSLMTEMMEFMGLKAFRFAIKRVDSDGGHGSKTILYFIGTNLQKSGFKVQKVTVKIKGKHGVDEHMEARDKELNHLQVFTKEVDCEWLQQEIIIFGVYIVESLEEYRYQLSDVLFAEQLWTAAQNKQWTDVDFAVKNHVYSAHRVILAARSSVFLSVLKSQVADSRIKIKDTSPIAFEIFLKFIYTGTFQVNSKKGINEEVLHLADRYKLSTLKSLCQLAVQDIDAKKLTALAMSMKPDFEICPRKPQLNGKAKGQLVLKQYFTVVECKWRLERLPDDTEMFTSDLLNFRNDGAFRAGLCPHAVTQHSTLLSPQHFLYMVCSHLEKTGTEVELINSYIDGIDFEKMDRRGEKALYVFGRELYDLRAPAAFSFDILVKETVDNYRYQVYDSLRSVDLWNMFEIGVMTDVELQVDGTKFFAHRPIITARSPVFATILGSSSVESVTGRIRIDGVSANVFNEFIYFLYTGTLQSSANGQALLNIAIKYEVETLIQICRIANEDVNVDEISTSIIWL